MIFTSMLSERLGLSCRTPGLASRPASNRRACPVQRSIRPCLEALEDRWVPSTLTVTNTLDSGAGSLRAEIAAAHTNDTIVFATSLDGQTITLTSGELLIKHNLTISGPGASQLTVSGNHASRVFEVKANESVTLSGLTISNGVAPGVAQSGEGGGILNHGTLTASGSILSGNVAAQDGGGIHNDGTLTVSGGSILSGNSSDQGGGLHNDGAAPASSRIQSGHNTPNA